MRCCFDEWVAWDGLQHAIEWPPFFPALHEPGADFSEPTAPTSFVRAGFVSRVLAPWSCTWAPPDPTTRATGGAATRRPTKTSGVPAPAIHVAVVPATSAANVISSVFMLPCPFRFSPGLDGQNLAFLRSR